MSKKKVKVEEKVEEYLLPILERYSFDLVDIEFIKEGSDWVLRIYIDKYGGINIDDCQSVSEEIGEILDKEDIIKHSYLLEVSSPGLDRPLKKDKDFERYKGELVEVNLFEAVDGKKQYEGTLGGLIEDKIAIIIDGKEKYFERKKVALVKRVIIF